MAAEIKAEKSEKEMPVQDEWQVVSDGEATAEIKMVFESPGDCFIGEFLGLRTIPSLDGGYSQARFRADGEVYFTNANYSLQTGLAKVRPGSRVRVTLTGEQDTGMENAMRVYEVAVSRTTQNAARASYRPTHKL